MSGANGGLGRWGTSSDFKNCVACSYFVLFDLEADPGGTRNIASLPSSTALVRFRSPPPPLTLTHSDLTALSGETAVGGAPGAVYGM